MTWKIFLIMSIASWYGAVNGQSFGSNTNSQYLPPLISCLRDFRDLMMQGVVASKLAADCDKANQTLISSGCTVTANANIVELQTKIRSYGENKVSIRDLDEQSSFSDLMSLAEQFRKCRGKLANSKTG